MGQYPTSCEEVLADLRERHQPFIDRGWLPIPIDKKEAILHRLLRQQDIDFETKKPSRSSFSNHGLSVLIESPGHPLDIQKEVNDSNLFVGAVALRVSYVEELGYEVCLDPHPDPLGKPQHPNHAQIVCKKTQGNTKKMRDNCIWSVKPDGI